MSNTPDDPTVTLEEVEKLVEWVETLRSSMDRLVVHAYLAGARAALIGSTHQQVRNDIDLLMK